MDLLRFYEYVEIEGEAPVLLTAYVAASIKTVGSANRILRLTLDIMKERAIEEDECKICRSNPELYAVP